MIRIRKISNPNNKANLRYLEKVKSIIREQFPDLSKIKIDEIGAHMTNPVKYKYQTSLFIAVDINESIRGFALFLHMSDLKFCYLDYIAVSPGKVSSGVGGALYERVREEARYLNATGIFFECLPDDPELCRDKSLIPQNQKRLAFYEKFDARPIANTLYETTVNEEDDCPPYLVFDGLGKTDNIPRKQAKEIIRAILERKYGDYCPDWYIKKILDSVKDEPVLLRPGRYRKQKEAVILNSQLSEKSKIVLYINDQHSIHHVKDRGYVESPVR
ncbi:MAG: GNAT family N-acetyltransferase, partial [Bacteroidales bacterium]|nr:GNAT family N-acetyltransferase [Bacteroidales bacterium]